MRGGQHIDAAGVHDAVELAPHGGQQGRPRAEEPGRQHRRDRRRLESPQCVEAKQQPESPQGAPRASSAGWRARRWRRCRTRRPGGSRRHRRVRERRASRCSAAAAATSRARDGRRQGGRRQRRGRARRRPCAQRSTSCPAVACTTLFNTHWHLDQVGSNEAFGSARRDDHRAREDALASHQRLLRPAEDRYEKPLPEAARPTETLHARRRDERRRSTDRVRLSHRSAHRRRHLCGVPGRRTSSRSATSSSPVRDPVLDWFGGGWLGGRVDALALLLERSDDNTRFVPSYGPVLRRAEVQAEHDMMLALFEIDGRARAARRERPGQISKPACWTASAATFEDPASFCTTSTKVSGRITTS